jgi:hypothetical protein
MVILINLDYSINTHEDKKAMIFEIITWDIWNREEKL